MGGWERTVTSRGTRDADWVPHEESRVVIEALESPAKTDESAK